MSGARSAIRLAIVVAALLAASVAPAFAESVPVKPGVAHPGAVRTRHVVPMPRPALSPSGRSRCTPRRSTTRSSSTKVAEGDKATGNKLGPFCRRCHAPVANMTGEDGSAQMSPASAEAITCSFCHQVTGTKKPLGNVSQLVEPSGVLRAQIEDPQSPHNPVYSAVPRDVGDLRRLPQRESPGQRHAPGVHLRRVEEEPAGQAGHPVPGLPHERVAARGRPVDRAGLRSTAPSVRTSTT